MQHKSFAYWLQTQLKVLQWVVGVSNGDGALQPQAGRHIWQAYIWNESGTLSPLTARLEKNKDRPDLKRPCPFPILTICSCLFVTPSCVSPHCSLPTKPKSGQEDIQVWDIWFQQPLPSNSKGRSTPPPAVSSTSRLFHAGSPRLWVHLATNIYSALPQRGQFKRHWCWGVLVMRHFQVPWYVK